MAATIIKDILRPEGASPRGNILLHCASGMHRTGMLFGIIRRAICNDPMPSIRENYLRHVRFISEAEPGGFEPLNLRFIEEFDISMIIETGNEQNSEDTELDIFDDGGFATVLMLDAYGLSAACRFMGGFAAGAVDELETAVEAF